MIVDTHIRYVLDTSVLIEAARRYYGFDIAPTFWNQLVQHAHKETIFSIDRVKDEIDKGKDELKDWCNNCFHKAFMSTEDQDVLDSYGEIMQWIQKQPQYTDSAKRELAEAENADAWVVAYAKAHDCVVVTHEQFNPNIKSRIPIPNISHAFNMLCIDTFQMMRLLGIRL